MEEDDSGWRLMCLHGVAQLHIPNEELPIVDQTNF